MYVPAPRHVASHPTTLGGRWEYTQVAKMTIEMTNPRPKARRRKQEDQSVCSQEASEGVS